MSDVRHGDTTVPKGAARSKLIVFGPSLQGRGGHNFNELLGYKMAAEALGRQPRIFVPHTSDPDVVSLLSAMPTLDVLPTIEIRPETMLRSIVAFADGSDLSWYWTAIEAEDPDQTDALLFTCASPALVRGIGLWLARRSPERRPSVFFRFLGAEIVDSKKGCHSTEAPFYRLACSELCTRSGQERVFFLVNNSATARVIARACRRRTFLTPMPKYLGETNADATPADHQAVYVAINGQSGALAGQLGEIIRRVRAGNPTVKFLVKFSGRTVQAARTAFQSERVANVETFPAGEQTVDYLENLARSTVVLLAYQPDYYRTMTSGVFSEAVGLGKPVVVPCGTWMAEQIAADRGVGVLCNHPTVEDISAAVLQALQSVDRLSAAAREIAPRLRAENSCQRVVELMLGLAQTTPDMEPRYQIGDEIDFSNALDSRCFMRGEWGDVEDWGVWTVGRNAGLLLKYEAKSPPPRMLRALVMPFLTENHRRMSVRVSIAGRQVAEWVFDVSGPVGAGWHWCEAAIPAAIGEEHSDQLDISFDVDTPMSPAALGLSPDQRTLGLGFQKLLLTTVDR